MVYHGVWSSIQAEAHCHCESKGDYWFPFCNNICKLNYIWMLGMPFHQIFDILIITEFVYICFFCNPMDCSLAGHGILQARILEWVAIPLSRGSSWPRNRTQISCTTGRFFTIWATRKVPMVHSKKKAGGGEGCSKETHVILHMSGYNPLLSLQANHQTLYSGSKVYITICLFFPFYQSLEVLPNLSF